MKKYIFCAVALLTFIQPCFAGIFSSAHTATLMIGSSQSETLEQAEHVLGNPIDVEDMSTDELGGIILKYYAFTDEHNIVLVFHQDVFLQLYVEKKVPEDLPYVGFVSEDLRGYILTKKKDKVDIQMLVTSNAQLSSGMLTLRSMDIAWMRFKENDYSQAKEIASLTLKEYPQNVNALNLLGMINMRENRLNESIENLSQALQILEEKPEERKDYILNNLGLVYVKLGGFDEAHKIFEKSIASAPNLNCAGRIGNYLSLIGVGQESMAQDTIKPCDDVGEVKATLEKIFNLFDIKNDTLKNKALGLMGN